jgi:hypothetical protein
MDNPNTEFSRYNGEEDDRGASMVAKHMKNMVANNREAALATLKAVWPQVSRPVHRTIDSSPARLLRAVPVAQPT